MCIYTYTYITNPMWEQTFPSRSRSIYNISRMSTNKCKSVSYDKFHVPEAFFSESVSMYTFQE